MYCPPSSSTTINNSERKSPIYALSDDIKSRTNQTAKNDFKLGTKEYNISNF